MPHKYQGSPLGEFGWSILKPMLDYLERKGIFGGFLIVVFLGLALFAFGFKGRFQLSRLNWRQTILILIWLLSLFVCIAIQIMMLRTSH